MCAMKHMPKPPTCREITQLWPPKAWRLARYVSRGCSLGFMSTIFEHVEFVEKQTFVSSQPITVANGSTVDGSQTPYPQIYAVKPS